MATELSQEASSKVLSTIFASKARVAILRVFMLDPYRAYYQRQLETATGLPIRAVQRELERLTDIELLYRRIEGNRSYYQVDVQFAVFPELRAMILKTATPEDRLRGVLALDERVQLALFCASEGRVLVVTPGERRPSLPSPGPFSIEVITAEAFTRALTQDPGPLEPFLVRGVDLLGRRDDVIWRRIEAAGYAVKKGEGVP